MLMIAKKNKRGKGQKWNLAEMIYTTTRFYGKDQKWDLAEMIYTYDEVLWKISEVRFSRNDIYLRRGSVED